MICLPEQTEIEAPEEVLDLNRNIDPVEFSGLSPSNDCPVGSMSRERMNECISELKKLPQQECPVRHYFSDGVYVREIFMPKGSCIVGAIHKTKHLNIVQQGRCLVSYDNEIIEIKAPYTFESKGGKAKVLVILEDTTWSTVHVTNEVCVEKLEEDLVENPEMLMSRDNRLTGGSEE